MTSVFFKLLEMSLNGSMVILVTVLTRYLLRRRSKWFIMMLWAVVAFRLLVPVNIGSVLSIYNYLPFSSHEIVREAQYKDATVPDYRTIDCDYSALVSLSPEIVRQDESIEHAKAAVTFTWAAGMSAIAGYYSMRYLLLRRRLRGARRIDENVYESDKISSAFVFGIFEPKIYLPDVLDNTERECILMHESTHIRHGDWILKVIGMAAVCIHWYNPFVWLGYTLFEQDLEMRCDEDTVSLMVPELRKAYTMSLVSFASRSRNRAYLVTPLGFSKNSFGSSSVAGRVRNIVERKKGTVRSTVSIVLALLLVAASLGFDAKAAMLTDLDYYSEDTGLKVVFSDGYYPINEDVVQVCREAASESGVFLEGLFFRDEEEDWADAVVCFETCDIRDIAPDDDDFTEGEYLTYYLRNEMGVSKYYVIMTEHVILSGHEYTKYTVSCLERYGGRVEIIYIGRMDEYHYSDIIIDADSYSIKENFDDWFVE